MKIKIKFINRMKSISAPFFVLVMLLISAFYTNQASAQITTPNNSGNSELNQQNDEIFTVVEVQPEYPGGDEARILFIRNNLHYPMEAKKAGIQGTVYVSFVIETDGSVTDIKILRGIGGGCDEEVVKMISKMPKWKPGRQRGETVRVQYNMPIKFTLAG